MRSTTTSGLLRPLTVAALAALVACSAPSSPPAPSPIAAGRPEEPSERREALRTGLRAKLGALYDEPVPAGGPAELERGARTYEMLCEACHGRTGRGNGRSARLLAIAPPDLSDPAHAAFFSDGAKLHIIAEGLPGSPMIGWKALLTEQERLEVLQFMNSLVVAGR